MNKSKEDIALELAEKVVNRQADTAQKAWREQWAGVASAARIEKARRVA